MDDFNWVSEPEKEKQNWFKEYWLHGIAAIVILALLLLLVFNPSSKKPNTEISEVAQNTTSATSSETKQITFRLPTKSLQETESPITLAEDTTAPEQSETTATDAAPEIKSTTVPLKSLPPASLGVVNRAKPTEIKDISADTPSTTTANSLVPAESLITGTANTSTTVANTTAPTTATSTQETNTASATTTAPTTSSAAPTTNAAPTATSSTVTNTQASTTNTATASTKAPTTTATPTASTPKTVAPIQAENPQPPATANVKPQTTSVLHMMLKRPATHYTVQLYASNSPSQVQQFVTQNNLAAKTSIVKVWQNGQDMYLLLYGDYTNQSQADAAINQLDPTLRSQNPWARSMQSVQDGIKQRLQRGR